MPASATSLFSFLPTTSLSSLVPTNTTNAITGLGNFIIGTLPQVPQYFTSIPFPNNQTVLYKFDLYDINTGQGSSLVTSYTFPLTPSNVTKRVANLTNYYDVLGSSANLGVQRIIDVFGLTPPIITISGTTGFQFHSLDQYQWSGRSSFALLVNLIQTYIFKVSIAAASQQNVITPPVLNFTDGYTGELYSVIPFGSQRYTMDSSRPIYQTYDLQFLAATSEQLTAVPLTQQDPVNVALLETIIALQTTANSWWQSILQGILPGALV